MRRSLSESPRVLCATMLLGVSLLPAEAQRNEAGQGAKLFVEYCAACHGADGRGGDKAPSLVSPSRAAASDANLAQVVHDGTRQGMPPFAQIGDTNIEVIVQYLRTLQGQAIPAESRSVTSLPGDPSTGRSLFFGKAQCSQCHMIHGDGGFIAGGLTTYGRNRTPEAILHAITHPDEPLLRSSRVVNITTRTGRRFTGVLRNEDNFAVDVQSEDGRYHMLARSDLSDIQYTGHSLMPRDYSARLMAKELNDIVSFLIVAGRTQHSELR